MHKKEEIDLDKLAVLQDNMEILDLLEQLKDLYCVRDVLWNEKVQVMSRAISRKPTTCGRYR